MQRRTLLKLGLVSGTVLALAGGAAMLVQPGLVQRRLTDAGRALFIGVGRAILQGTLPADPAEQRQALEGRAGMQAAARRAAAAYAGVKAMTAQGAGCAMERRQKPRCALRTSLRWLVVDSPKCMWARASPVLIAARSAAGVAS